MVYEIKSLQDFTDKTNPTIKRSSVNCTPRGGSRGSCFCHPQQCSQQEIPQVITQAARPGCTGSRMTDFRTVLVTSHNLTPCCCQSWFCFKVKHRHSRASKFSPIVLEPQVFTFNTHKHTSGKQGCGYKEPVFSSSTSTGCVCAVLLVFSSRQW